MCVPQSALNAFDDLPRFKGAEKARLIAALERMLAGLDEKKQPSLTGQIKTLLANAAKDADA